MSFMQKNRAKNGAPQPKDIQPKGGKSPQLSPNTPFGDTAKDERFSPSMGSPAAINEDHYQGGVSGSGPYKDAYGSHIPFVGTPADDSHAPLKNR